MANAKSIKLVVSEHDPGAIAQGHKVKVEMVDEHLKPAKAVGARLCDGSGTCVAIMETE